MARNRRRLGRNTKGINKSVERHILALQLTSGREYLEWCSANGFSAYYQKSKKQLEAELAFDQRDRALKRQMARINSNPKALLQDVALGLVTSDAVLRPYLRGAVVEIEASDPSPDRRQSLAAMLAQLAKRQKLVFGTIGQPPVPVMRGLINVHTHRSSWLRPLEDWRPKSGNAERQFVSLIHHLFDRYGDVPAFMDGAWLRDDASARKFQWWFVALGRGANLRTLDSPVQVTKRIAHEFMRAPAHYSVEQALRWGQLKSLGAGRPLIDAVAASRLGRSFANEDFWLTFLRYIANLPMLDPRAVGPLVDYIQNQRFQPIVVEVEPGEFLREPPPQPGFTLRGRSLESLLEQVHGWHQSLGRISKQADRIFPKSAIEGLQLQRISNMEETWTIRQIATHRDLYQEGKALGHCVFSYSNACMEGACTIWSLSRATGDQPSERRVTIEVIGDAEIVQCRGLANRLPRSAERSIITAWAKQTGLKLNIVC